MARVIETRDSRILLAVLVLTHLVLVSRQVDVGGGTSLLERTVFRVLSPVQTGVGATVRAVRGALASYVWLRGVASENEALRGRLRAAEVELQRVREEAREAPRLRELLELRQVLPLQAVAGHVIARDGTPWFRTVTLDVGQRRGVRLDDAVISPTGVVGRVVEVGPEAAKVQLLLDRDSGVGARIERSRVTGVVGGQVGFADRGTSDLVMKYVPALADVVVGDVVVTSGLDRIFPKGLVVGRVRSAGAGDGLFKELQVAPSAGFERLDEVLVLRPPAVDLALTQGVR